MKFVSVSGVISPKPGLLVRYIDGDGDGKDYGYGKKRKRFIPIRDKDFFSNCSQNYCEKILDSLISRHGNYLKTIERKSLVQVLMVLQEMNKGSDLEDSTKKIERQLKDYQPIVVPKPEKKVSFKEGPHDVQEISDDDFEVELPDEGDNLDKIESNFSWNDEDDNDFVF